MSNLEVPPVFLNGSAYHSTDTASNDTSSTIEQCPQCRAALSSAVGVARARAATLAVFARQITLEVEELALLLRNRRFDAVY